MLRHTRVNGSEIAGRCSATQRFVRVALMCTLLPAIVVASARCGSEHVTGPTPTPPVTATLLAAGDIGVCGSAGAGHTGQLLDVQPGIVIAVGDLAYPSGTAQQFATCYEEAWGRHRSRTYPAPGNHEYDTAGASPYFDYFGSRAGPPGQGYYSFRAGSWLVLSLNSNVPSDRASPQADFIRSELAGGDRCVLAYFHHPLYSSGRNGDNPRMGELWSLLYDRNVDVIVSAHDHLYERFAPIRPDGSRDDARGIRQFISGAGGAPLYDLRTVHAASEARIKAYGILKLTLSTDRYEWEFLQIDGSRADAGVGSCH